jgi:hypothetical protein
MTHELTTQEQLDAFADEVARELGTHCRMDRLTGYGRGVGRLIIDGDGRALRPCQPDGRRPDRLPMASESCAPTSHRTPGADSSTPAPPPSPGA